MKYGKVDADIVEEVPNEDIIGYVLEMEKVAVSHDKTQTHYCRIEALAKVRSERRHATLINCVRRSNFNKIQDVKVKGHHSCQVHCGSEVGRFEPDKFEGQYETALIDLINQKRASKNIRPQERPKAGMSPVSMRSLRRSVGATARRGQGLQGNTPGSCRKASGGQMSAPIAGRKQGERNR